MIYKTGLNETLDMICLKYYGNEKMLHVVLSANKDLCKHDFILPPNLIINMPEVKQEKIKQGVTLW